MCIVPELLFEGVLFAISGAICDSIGETVPSQRSNRYQRSA